MDPLKPAPGNDCTSINTRARILIVEDEALVALETARVLREAEFRVVGPASSVVQALELIKTVGCDAAVLDAMLGSETSEPVARALGDRCTPFITQSAYSQEQLPTLLRCAPFVAKPLRPERLLLELRRCLKGAPAQDQVQSAV
jgi:DNA-binding response OmpR family regulator